jgi:pimeloyl-ACP methyl ester carboxylesterase
MPIWPRDHMHTMDNFTDFETHIIATSHGRVSVSVRQGTQPALVLVHGNSFSGDIFANLASDPALNGIMLIIPDLPGHGASENAPNPSQTYNYTGFGDCIEQVVMALKVQSYMIFGWSLGGQIAIEMLDQAPGLMGVVTCGSAVVQRGPLGMINGFHFTRDLFLAGKAAFKPAEASRFSEICTGQSSVADIILRADTAMRPALSRACLFGKGRDQRAIIAGTQTPAYLMLGENDPFIRTDYFAKIKGQSLFGGKPQIFTNCGHAPFIDDQTGFARRLAVFHQHVEATAQLPKRDEEPMRLAS